MRIPMILLGLSALACQAPDPAPGTDEGSLLTEGEGSTEAAALDKVQYVDLLDGRTAVLITLSGAEGTETITWHFEGTEIEANDGGFDGDETAGDGVFTGVADANMDEFNTRREDYRLAAEVVDGGLRAHVFSGHRAQAIEELEADFLDHLESEEVDLAQLGGTFTAVTVFPSVSTAAGVAPPPSVYDPRKSLMITSPEVVYNPELTGVWEKNADGDCVQVGDPNGPFGFRYLLEAAAGGLHDGDEIISDWINKQAASRTVNNYSTLASTQYVWDLHNGWFGNTWSMPKLVDDGQASVYTDVLDARSYPVQLIAIVNRLDLAAGGYGGEPSGAEVRFVFTLVEPDACEPFDGNLILEYHVPMDECHQVEDWAQRWAQLDGMQPHDPAFQQELRDLVDPVVMQGAAPGRVNESNLKVLRTNETGIMQPHYLSGFPSNDSDAFWRMEEWELDATSGLLVNKVLAQTPGWDWMDPGASGSTVDPEDIDAWIDANEADILAGQHQVPLSYLGDDMASPEVLYGHFPNNGFNLSSYSNITATDNWRGMSAGSANVNSIEARQLFSLGTCNGCHAAETFEDGTGTGAFEERHWAASLPGSTLEEPFRHVAPGGALGDPAKLSRFLTGTNTTCSPGNEFVSPLGTLTQCSSSGCCPIGDPVFGYASGQVHYNEFARRGDILQDVVLNGCSALRHHENSAVIASAH